MRRSLSQIMTDVRRQGSLARRGPPKRDPSEAIQRGLAVLKDRFGFTDVGYNPGQREIYIFGPAKRLQALIHNQMWTRRVVLGITRDDDYRYRSIDMWDDLEYALLDVLGSVTKDREQWYEWVVFPVPNPGLPQHWWWSVRKGKWMAPELPPPFSVCSGPPVPFGEHEGPILLQLPEARPHKNAPWVLPQGLPFPTAAWERKAGGRQHHGRPFLFPPLMMSHGLTLEDLKLVEQCGGLLWPSWAISWRVPPSYGDLVFLADVRALTSRMRPTGRPDRRVLINATDVWSLTARELLQYQMAVNRERRVERKWWNGDYERRDGGWGNRGVQNDLLSAGLKAEDVVSTWAATSPQVAQLRYTQVKTRAQFVSALRGLMAEQVVEGQPYLYPQRPSWQTHGQSLYQYPYFEAKVTGIVKVSDLAACVYPRRNARRVNAFLDRAGFAGFRIPFSWGGTRRGHHIGAAQGDAERREWATRVTQAILGWALRPCSTRGVQVPPQHRGARQGYEPVAVWWKRGDVLGWWFDRC